MMYLPSREHTFRTTARSVDQKQINPIFQPELIYSPHEVLVRLLDGSIGRSKDLCRHKDVFSRDVGLLDGLADLN